MAKKDKLVLKYEEVGIGDVGMVGGKNASLGEMIRFLVPKGISIPSGFVITAEAYRYFLRETGLDKFIKKTLRGLNTSDLSDLAKRGEVVRSAIRSAEFPGDLRLAISKYYATMEKKYGRNVDVAVRSSATAEDLPGASFAGEHDTYLNIRGAENVAVAAKWAMASLFTNRAISYRVDKGFDHLKVALSVGVQKMVRSDLGASGVMFTLDTESGFRDIVLINGSWGLGEMIVQGEVTPDEFVVWKRGLAMSSEKFPRKSVSSPRKSVFMPIIGKVLGVKNQKMIYSTKAAGTKQTKIINTSSAENDKFVLNDKEIVQLAKWGAQIEEHYSKKNKHWMPMDMEWAKDGRSGELYIVQARPETIHASRDYSIVKEYVLQPKSYNLKPIVKGASVGSKIATGSARIILSAKNVNQFKKGEVLVTGMTDPDWEPIMKIAAAIVTDKGGRTSHAAIVSRELGIPCIVGSGDATRVLKTGQTITVDTTGSEGFVFNGFLKFHVVERDVKKLPHPKTKIMMNIATPETAYEKSFLPNSGVGLAREEFIIASQIGVHPNALLDYKKLDGVLRRKIDRRVRGWASKTQFYVDNLAYGIAKIGASFYPNHVIVRFSDFKTNEYRTLLGGEAYEPVEENPMLGWRGASRYYDPKFAEAFRLECLAIKKVRGEMGLKNVVPMIPFCRTTEEGRKVVQIMKAMGLDRAKDKTLKIYVMCEIPSNVLLADEFLDIFDGMSIGSNDLTQLTLGLDRDSGIVSKVANEKDPAVKKLVAEVIAKCRKRKKYIGICGQAPSDYPDFAEFLVERGIESISVNPDVVVKTTILVAKKEKGLKK